MRMSKCNPGKTYCLVFKKLILRGETYSRIGHEKMIETYSRIGHEKMIETYSRIGHEKMIESYMKTS
jgi:hypothetical protein